MVGKNVSYNHNVVVSFTAQNAQALVQATRQADVAQQSYNRNIQAGVAQTQSISRVQQEYQSRLTQVSATVNTTGRNVATMGQQFTAGLNPIKNSGNALNQFNTTTKTTGVSLSKFGGFVQSNLLSIGLLAVGIANLDDQFNSLQKAQVGLERAHVIVSKANNRVEDTQRRLNKMVAEGKTGTSEYTALLADHKIAKEAAAVASDREQVAQTNLNEATESFWTGIIPNAIAIGGSMATMTQSLGLKVDHLRDLFGKGGIAAKLFSSNIALIATSSALAGAGALALIAVIEDFKRKSKDAFTQDQVGLLPDPTSQSAKQFEEMQRRTKLSIAQMVLDWDGAVEKFRVMGGKFDKAGKIIITAQEKVFALPSGFKETSDVWISWMAEYIRRGESQEEIIQRLTKAHFDLATAKKIAALAEQEYAENVETGNVVIDENLTMVDLYNNALQITKDRQKDAGAQLQLYVNMAKGTNRTYQSLSDGLDDYIAQLLQQGRITPEVANEMKKQAGEVFPVLIKKEKEAAEAKKEHIEVTKEADEWLKNYTMTLQDQVTAWQDNNTVALQTNETLLKQAIQLGATRDQLWDFTAMFGDSATKIEGLNSELILFNLQQARIRNFLDMNFKLQDNWNRGLLEGTMQAHDFMLSLSRDQAVAEAFHQELAKYEPELSKIQHQFGLTNEQIMRFATLQTEGGDSLEYLAGVINEQAGPALEYYNKLLHAGSKKEFGEEWKDTKKQLKKMGLDSDTINLAEDNAERLNESMKAVRNMGRGLETIQLIGIEEFETAGESFEDLADNIIKNYDRIQERDERLAGVTGFEDYVKRVVASGDAEGLENLRKIQEQIQIFLDNDGKIDPDEAAIIQMMINTGKAAEGATKPTEDLSTAMDDIIENVILSVSIDQVTKSLDKQGTAAANTTSFTEDLEGAMDDLESSNETAAGAIQDTTDDLDNLTDALEEAAGAAQDLADDLEDIPNIHRTVEIETIRTGSVQHGGSWIRNAQHGLTGIITRPTIMDGVRMGEHSKPELITVTPLTNPSNVADTTVKLRTKGGDSGLTVDFMRKVLQSLENINMNATFKLQGNDIVRTKDIFTKISPLIGKNLGQYGM